MRIPFAFVVGAVVGVSPGALVAQDHSDHAVAGGKLPAGWSARLDKADASLENVRVVEMGEGLHVTVGPAVILYREQDRASGTYRVSAGITLTKPSRHPEAYGLFIGGAELQGPDPRYTYLLVRQDGKFLVKRRSGTQTHTVVDWTAHESVRAPEGEGSASNEFAIEVGRQQVRFLVNGAQVAAVPRSAVDADGIYGYRVNHNLDVHLNPIRFSAQGR